MFYSFTPLHSSLNAHIIVGNCTYTDCRASCCRACSAWWVLGRQHLLIHPLWTSFWGPESSYHRLRCGRWNRIKWRRAILSYSCRHQWRKSGSWWTGGWYRTDHLCLNSLRNCYRDLPTYKYLIYRDLVLYTQRPMGSYHLTTMGYSANPLLVFSYCFLI